MTNELIVHHERCKACGYCIHFCPKGALSVSDTINEKGYDPVTADMSKCIGCRICYTVCPDYVFELRKGDQ